MVLYNGIRLPDVWPPQSNRAWFEGGREPMPVPYLAASGIPAVIPIDVGRQLLVDDFLIEASTLVRTCHRPQKHEGNPIVRPKRDYEGSSLYAFGEPSLWDPVEQVFKLWYAPDHWVAPRALLYSEDGIKWRRPNLGIVGDSNIVLPSHERLAILSVIQDFETSDAEPRFKAHGWEDGTRDSVYLVSPDGVRWREVGRIRTRYDDTTNIFYNPFRKKWVYNPKVRPGGKRTRLYAEVDTFEELYDETRIHDIVIPWYRADAFDDASSELEHQDEAQVYDLFAIPYESIMLGAINLHYGPENDICKERRMPKLLQVHVGYSRDGFHWHRPTREPFIPAERGKGQGARDFGYLRPVGNVVNIVGDRLLFYYMAASGIDKDGNPGMYTGITINLATLRRDGFTSMDAGTDGGTLTTRPVTFQGKHLFVNVDCPEGRLQVEVLDEDNNVIEPLTAENCIPLSLDTCKSRVDWRGVDSLAGQSGRPVRFRFHLAGGSLYSFWVSRDATGASGGYVAGGGPGFAGAKDV